MLTGLHIKDYAIVESLDLDIHEGMTVITGETGAGKSIMLDALGLVLGARADSQTVRPGAARCDISASFDLQSLPEASRWLIEQELSADDDCILRRTITSDGRSKNFINQHPVTLAQLKMLGEKLIHIHSQHAQQLLLQADHQREWLDQYSQNSKILRVVRGLAEEYSCVNQQLEQLRASGGNPDQIALLQYQLSELDELNLQEGEFESLEDTFKTASKAEQVLGQTHQAMMLLQENDEGNVLAMLGNIQRQLQAIKTPSTELTSILDCVHQAIIQSQEAYSQLVDYQGAIQMDPKALSELEQRIEKIHAISRKHHCEPEVLFESHQALRHKLFLLENSEQAITDLESKLNSIEKNYRVRAQELTQHRQKSSGKFAKKIEEHIHQLGMPKGEVAIVVTPQPDALPSVHGQDKIEFLVRTNPGQPMNPLAKVVSGGELSRISLAIQVIGAERENTATLIFDEVDVGIGGTTAAIVGRLLRELGKSTQVICVTHQPQVAACGDHHLRVEKITGKNSTITKISALTKTEKVDEIARMLGGLTITSQTTAHAEALIAEAVCN